MLRRFFILPIILFFGACGPQTSTQPTDEVKVDRSTVKVTQLAPGVWLHTSSYQFPGGAVVPSNGLAVKDGEGLILIDTAWGELETQSLAKKLEAESGLPIEKVVITHFHYDRLAGVDWLESQGATVYTHPLTPVKSAALGTPVPNTSVASLKAPQSRSAIGPIEIAFPGPAHTEDNLVVYVKGAKILFGGCAVRAANHKSLGNIADADISKWGPSIAWVKAVYKDAKTVVPSHGAVGDMRLLDHTLALAAKANEASEAAAETPPEP